MDKRECEGLVEVFKKYLCENLVSIVLFGSCARNEEFHDIDVFLIAYNLPKNTFDRQMFLRAKLISGKVIGSYSILAKTVKEFEEDIIPVYLDIAIDGKVLFDTNNYITEKLKLIRKIIKNNGLYRIVISSGFRWKWRNPPSPGKWSITWQDAFIK